ncbi:MAG TPA: hypothetical protein VH518_20920 [Tepidisphaeraceae bacterium]|jgi:type IV secretory pathway TrbL component
MRTSLVTGCLLAATAVLMLIVGCEKKEGSAAGVNQAVQDAAKTASDAGKAVADKAADAGNAVAQKASDAAATITAEAQKYLDQVTEYVKDKKWDLADEALKKLEAIKDKLPTEWAAKIDSAKDMLTKAKAAVK